MTNIEEICKELGWNASWIPANAENKRLQDQVFCINKSLLTKINLKFNFIFAGGRKKKVA